MKHVLKRNNINQTPALKSLSDALVSEARTDLEGLQEIC